MLFICRRGRENLREMTKTTFGVGIDASRRQYVFQIRGELDKNHRAENRPDQTTGEGRMYEWPGDQLCQTTGEGRMYEWPGDQLCQTTGEGRMYEWPGDQLCPVKLPERAGCTNGQEINYVRSNYRRGQDVRMARRSIMSVKLPERAGCTNGQEINYVKLPERAGCTNGQEINYVRSNYRRGQDVRMARRSIMSGQTTGEGRMYEWPGDQLCPVKLPERAGCTNGQEINYVRSNYRRGQDVRMARRSIMSGQTTGEGRMYEWPGDQLCPVKLPERAGCTNGQEINYVRSNYRRGQDVRMARRSIMSNYRRGQDVRMARRSIMSGQTTGEGRMYEWPGDQLCPVKLPERAGCTNGQEINYVRSNYRRGQDVRMARRSIMSGQTTGEGRMYEWPGDQLCPVSNYKLYIGKLNAACSALWQRPYDTYNPDDDTWYCNAPIGAHGLSDMMTDISKLSGLSRIYSNHSIRATCITLLDDSGIEARHIMRVSGHRNEVSIRSYASRLDDKKKRQISDCISDAIAPKKLCAPAVLA